MGDVVLEHLKVLAVFVALTLGKLLATSLVRLIRFAQEAVLLAQLAVLLGEFGQLAFQVTKFERLVTVLSIGGLEGEDGVIIGLLQVMIVVFEGLNGWIVGGLGECFGL